MFDKSAINAVGDGGHYITLGLVWHLVTEELPEQLEFITVANSPVKWVQALLKILLTKYIYKSYVFNTYVLREFSIKQPTQVDEP